jgi:hypothetical protein
VEIVVDGSPKACLTKAYDHFRRGWPFGGTIVRYNDAVRVTGERPSTWMDSAGGIAMILFLTLITGGVYGLIYIVYSMMFGDNDLWQVQVGAEPYGGAGHA